MIIHSDNWEEKIMTGNKEAYFYLTSSLEKIFPDTDCVKENDQHTISIFKGELPAFCLCMEAAVIMMVIRNVLQKALLMR